MKKPKILLLLLLLSAIGKAQTSALSFDGVDDYVNCGSNFNASTIKTMECWVKFNSFTGDQEIISKSIPGQGLEMLLFGGKLNVYCMFNGSNYSFISYPLSNLRTGIWYHLAFTWDGTKESMRLYVDGKPVGSRTDGGNINTTGIADVASVLFGNWSDPSSRYFNGTLDEVRLWNTTRTAAEIKAGMYGTVATNTGGLLAYYKLNEGAGTTTSNYSTSPATVAGSTGTLFNGTAWFAFSPVQGGENGLHFDGSNDHIAVPANPAYDFTTGTIECWIRTENLVGNTCIIGNRSDPTTRYSFHISSSAIGLWNNSTYNTIPYTVVPGQWYHLAFVCVPGNTTVYVNGVSIGTTGNGVGTATGLPLCIGMPSPGTAAEQFSGSMDEVRIWNTARTVTEIQANMNVSLTGNEANLVGLFSFNQGVAGGNNEGLVTAIDGTSLQNHGTLTNFNLTGSTSNWISHSTTLSNPAPVVTSFTPTAAGLGTSITISGNNFNTTPVNNIVYFGGTKATVTAASTTSLTVTVPAGAAYGPLTVINSAYSLLGTSSLPFSTTFSGTGYTFLPKTDINTGQAPKSVLLGDLDGDGKADLVTANSASNDVSVSLNNSSGSTISFGGIASYETNAAPSGLAFGDMDADGKLDVIVANTDGNSVTIMHNASTPGVQNFDAFTDIPLATGPYSVAVADIDGDGLLDIVTVNNSGSFVSVLRNTSSGGILSFAARVDFTTGTGPFHLTVADIDRDGKTDIITANPAVSTVSVLRNTSDAGTISFDTKLDFGSGANAAGVSVADVDGDGKLDLLAANNGTNTISVLRSTSSPGAIAFEAKADFTVGSNPYLVAAADVDGDGKVDLVAVNNSSQSVSVLKNTSSPGLLAFDAKADYTTGVSPRSIAVTDLDGDGRPDLAVANQGDNTVSILQNVQGVTLPVTGLRLVAAKATAGVQLNWSTVTETNSRWFEIERSGNGRAFTAIGRVLASGTTTQTANYGFADKQPLNGMNYYRLRQTDNDGQAIYSSVVTVKWNDEKAVTVSVSPQPVHSTMKVVVAGFVSNGVFAIYDLNGKIIKSYPVKSGDSSFELDRTGLSSGLYFFRLSNDKNEAVKTGKILVD